MLKHLRNREEWDGKSLPQKGFTLVELLVVIVILGILAAVVVFAVGGSTDKAQTSACKAERSAVETAVEAYRASVGSYPTDRREHDRRYQRVPPFDAGVLHGVRFERYRRSRPAPDPTARTPQHLRCGGAFGLPHIA